MKSNFDMLRLMGIRRKKDARDKKYATLNRRMLAATVDSFLMMLFIAPPLEWMFTAAYGPMPSALQTYNPHASPQEARQALATVLGNPAFQHRWLADTSVQMLVFLVVSGLCWRLWSATPGKLVFSIVIADADTETKLNNGQILRRLFGYGASFFCLFGGFVWIAFDKRRQGWHDKIAHSVVLVQPWRQNPLYGPLYGSLYKAFQLLVGKVSRHHQQRDK